MIDELKSLFPNRIITSEKELACYLGDYWPRTLLQKRLGEKLKFPKAVIYPESIKDIQTLVHWAARRVASSEKISLIPWGAGSGVCGGTAPIEDSIMVSLRRLNHVQEIEPEAQYVKAETGILGPDLENALNHKGLTLNHFPTSFAISTLGGWISTRASGQFSTAYGSIEDMVLAMKVVLSDGSVIETKLSPKSATGPNLNKLFLGAEGTLGFVVEATLQAHRLAKHRDFLSFSFRSVEEGLLAIRSLLHRGIFPAVLRLYDETDTQLALSEVGIKESGNLLIVVLQGEKEIVQFQRSEVENACTRKGKDLGQAASKHWWEHRFALNEKKLVQVMSSEGMILDTIEVATTWNHLRDLYLNMKKAMEEAGVTVLAHFSHFYVTGGCIYFTFIGNVEEKDALTKYDLVWEKAMDACLKSHGTISHHHGIGLLRRKWIQQELGAGYDVLLKIKKALDPNNILNPGKLL